LCDSSPRQHAWRSTGEAPRRNFPTLVFDFDVKPDMRVLPFHFLNHSGHADRFSGIVFGRKRVMGKRSHGASEQSAESESDSFYFHDQPLILQRYISLWTILPSTTVRTERICLISSSFTLK